MRTPFFTKKANRATFDELRRTMPVLSENAQRGYIGRSSYLGTACNPISQSAYISMRMNGTWPGGWADKPGWGTTFVSAVGTTYSPSCVFNALGYAGGTSSQHFFNTAAKMGIHPGADGAFPTQYIQYLAASGGIPLSGICSSGTCIPCGSGINIPVGSLIDIPHETGTGHLVKVYRVDGDTIFYSDPTFGRSGSISISKILEVWGPAPED